MDTKECKIIYRQELSPKKKALRYVGIFVFFAASLPLAGVILSILDMILHRGGIVAIFLFLTGFFGMMFLVLMCLSRRAGVIFENGFISCEKDIREYIGGKEPFVPYDSIESWEFVKYEENISDIGFFHIKLKGDKYIKFSCLKSDDVEFSEILKDKLSKCCKKV